MKKNEFDNRLQNDLFPEMPASFGRKLKEAMEKEGVKIRKRPSAAGILAGVVSVAAAAAVLLIVLVGVMSGGKSNPIQAAAPGLASTSAATETPQSTPAVTEAPYTWDWSTKIIFLAPGFEFVNEEKTKALYTGILTFLKEQGESEPDELWLCAIKSRCVKEDTGYREDGYLSGYYALAQHAFGENDGPELYCLSEDFEVLWCTEGSVPGPNHAVNPEKDNYTGTYQGHFLYGMAPAYAHVTRGALVGTNPKEKTDIEFSMATSLTQVQERLEGSAHLNLAREYFLMTVPASSWDSVMANPILRFETAEGNVDVNMKTDLPKSTVVLGDRFTFSPIPTFEPNIPPEPTTTPDIPDPIPTMDPNSTPKPMETTETKVLDLTGRTCLTGEPDYGALILRALAANGVSTPRELWLCAVDPFSENEDTNGLRVLVLAQYTFEGATGPELFLYEDGRIRWMTQGYEPERINVLVDEARHITVLFGVSNAYDGRALAMTEGTVTIAGDEPRTFGPVLPLEQVQRIVGEGPHYDYAREFYLCSLPNGGEVTGLTIKTAERTFTCTGKVNILPLHAVMDDLE